MTQKEHVCTITPERNATFASHRTTKSVCHRLKIGFKKFILISEINPQSIEYFRSTAEIIQEREKHLKSKSWIIHPFSKVYFEIWMIIYFTLYLLFITLSISYSFILARILYLDYIFSIFYVMFMAVTFRTGYWDANNESVVMKPSLIAKKYVFSFYFVCDILTIIPDVINTEEHITYSVINNALGLFAVFRIFTALTYLKRTLHYFRIRNIGLIKTLVLIVFVMHFSCCIYFAVTRSTAGEFMIGNAKYSNIQISTDAVLKFFAQYASDAYYASAVLLGIEVGKNFTGSNSYMIGLVIVGLCFGKFFFTYVGVIAVNFLKSGDNLEVKYFAMMQQVDAYMACKQYPVSIQQRIKKYYFYRYRQKYFNENRIAKYISESLRREIKYHSCRRMVHSAKIFEELPQRIMEEILSYLHLEIYLSNDIIIQAGLEGDCMFFLGSGTVVVMSPSGKEICHLEDGAYFGEICLLVSDSKRSATVSALETCEVYRLDRKSFNKCMKDNRKLLRKLQQEAARRFQETRIVESTMIKKTTIMI